MLRFVRPHFHITNLSISESVNVKLRFKIEHKYAYMLVEISSVK
jgi:hypothetical protein